MNEVTQRLLEAHVQHELARLSGTSLASLIDVEVSESFEWLADVPLHEVVTVDRVMGAIERFVFDLRVSGGITELAGEIARVVFTSSANEGTRVDEVLTTDAFEEFSDKILAFDRLRRELISLVVHSNALTDAGARIISHVVADLLSRRLSPLRHSKVAGLGERLETRLLPGIEQRLTTLLAEHLERRRARFAREAERHLVDVLDGDLLRGILDDVWQGLGEMPLSEAFTFLGEQDLEDFVVFVFEFWMRFRKTRYLREVLAQAVGHFFAKYGDESVLTLIEDMGVDADMVVRELQTFLIPLFDHAARTGFLERRLRAELATFYESAACARALTEP